MKRRQGLRGICCSKTCPKSATGDSATSKAATRSPNEESFAASRAALALLKKAKRDTLVFYLVSGGGSAMFDLPLDPKISLADTVAFHDALLGCGAPINEINTLRKHFSAVKGGRLAIAAPDSLKILTARARCPSSHPRCPLLRPLIARSLHRAEVHEIIEKYNLAEKFPPSVNAFFQQADCLNPPGTRHGSRLSFPASAEASPARRPFTSAASLTGEDEAFRDSVFEVLLSISTHRNARTLAQKAGYFVSVDNSCDDWDYADAARYLLDRFHELRTLHPRFCLISGGEVTVTLNRNPGAGGRNQQFALACALELAHYPARFTVLSAGSDGIDGNTQSAGAIADPTTVARAQAFGFDPEQTLRTFNACPLFTALGDTVVTGPPVITCATSACSYAESPE